MSKPGVLDNTEQLLSKLAGMPDPARQARFLSRNKRLLSAELVAALAERVREQVRLDVLKALQTAEAALAIANQLGDKESQAKALRAKANALYSRGEHASAVDLHQQAAGLFAAIGNTHEMARTLSGSIQPLLLMGEYSRAFAAGERAKQIFLAEGNAWRLARLEINIGNIYYRQDRFEDALACYQRAREGLPPQQDPEGVAAVFSNMATCYISLNAFPKALEAYKQARQFCAEHNMPLLVSQADYNIASLYYRRGQYNRAIEMFRAARVNCKKVKDEYHGALCDLDLSELYLELNLNSEAAELAQQGFEAFQKLEMRYESAKSLAFSASAASEQGHAFEALQLFSRAREMFVREKNRVWPFRIDLYRARVFFDEGRLFEARRLCTEARDALQSLHLSIEAVAAELLLARIALRTEESDTALQCAGKALKELAELEAPVLAYTAHLLMGNSYAARHDSGLAYIEYCAARDILETLRGGLRSEELKIAFVKDRLEVYENLVELCLARNRKPSDVEEAFTYVEQAKSRSLMDLFIRPAPTVAEAEPGMSDLVRSIRNLREELNWYYNLIERGQLQPEAQSPEHVESLRKQAQQREKELQRMLQEATESETSQAGLQTPSHLPVAAVRAAIPPDTLLVEYFRVRDRILACLLGPQTLEIVPVTLEPRVANVLRLLQFQLSKFQLHPDYVQQFQLLLLQSTQAHLKELYDELIAPIASQLQARHLIFVPHGPLHYVPFHALFDGSQYLIDRHTISYSPSASIFSLCQARSANTSGRALILGVPDSQAPAILDEIQELADLLPDSELLVGRDASEQALRTKGPQSRLIHIATHGHFRQDNPMFSAVRLGDSFLSLYDLYNLHLPVDLVTLSGCSTGLNVIAAGDELIGLARGLLHAGAQSLVLSLWEVHDRSTAEYMKGFYRYLEEGQSKPIALRQAMLDLRSRYPHPYQWAPFILIGKV